MYIKQRSDTEREKLVEERTTRTLDGWEAERQLFRAQVLYEKGYFGLASQAIEKCLRLKPAYDEAREWYRAAKPNLPTLLKE